MSGIRLVSSIVHTSFRVDFSMDAINVRTRGRLAVTSCTSRCNRHLLCGHDSHFPTHILPRVPLWGTHPPTTTVVVARYVVGVRQTVVARKKMILIYFLSAILIHRGRTEPEEVCCAEAEMELYKSVHR